MVDYKGTNWEELQAINNLYKYINNADIPELQGKIGGKTDWWKIPQSQIDSIIEKYYSGDSPEAKELARIAGTNLSSAPQSGGGTGAEQTVMEWIKGNKQNPEEAFNDPNTVLGANRNDFINSFAENIALNQIDTQNKGTSTPSTTGTTATTTPATTFDINKMMSRTSGGKPVTITELKRAGLWTEPTKSEVLTTKAYYKQLMPELSDADAMSMAQEDLYTSKFNQAVSQYDANAKESEISGIIRGMPEAYKTQEADLAKRLGEYGSQTFKDELLPAITQSYGARGIADSGALNVALAKESGKIAQNIQEQLAPGAINTFLSQQGLSLEQALRQAQQAGTKGQALQQYGQGLYGNALGSLGNQAQANLGNALSKDLYAFQQPYMKDMYNYQSGINLSNSKALSDYSYGQQADLASQQAQGGAIGMLLSSLLGGGLGATAPAIGFGAGALAGLTGKKTW